MRCCVSALPISVGLVLKFQVCSSSSSSLGFTTVTQGCTAWESQGGWVFWVWECCWTYFKGSQRRGARCKLEWTSQLARAEMEWKFSGPAGRTASFLFIPEVFEEAWKLLAAVGKDETSWLGHAPRARYYSPLVNVSHQASTVGDPAVGFPKYKPGRDKLGSVTENQFGYVRYGVQMQYQGLHIWSCQFCHVYF